MIAGDILTERARLSPEREALVCAETGERFTYRQLDRRATAFAHVLYTQYGIRKGDRVGILSENSVSFLDAFFAAGRSGPILVPLNTRLTPIELQQIAEDCDLKILLFSARYATSARQVAARTSVILAPLEEIDLSIKGASSFTRPFIGPEDIYLLLYTSGTTGSPKGVMLPHRMIAFNAYNTIVSWQLRDDDVTSIFTPLYHAGMCVSLTALFLIGGRVLLHDGFNATAVWHGIERERITFFFAVPTIFKMLTEVPEWQTLNMPHLRWCISGGAPLPEYILQTWQQRGIVMKQGYGLTEAGVNCFAMSDEEAFRKPGSIGKPMLFTQARLASVEECGEGPKDFGELCIRGPHVASGYWNRPDETAATFDKEGWLHTGDLARRDEDGFYYIVGRQKEVLISGGVNVYPAEIEAVLHDHAAVDTAAVIGVPDPKWGEVPVAYIILRPSALPSHDIEEELRGFLEMRLAKFKVPKQFVFVTELPRTASGKVMKRKLTATFPLCQ